jgi:NAD-dependent DNA ligase
LPDVAKYIIGYSFSDCTKLKEVVMPSVTKINREAFYDCKALKKIVVSEKLICIEDMAFVDCGNFKIEAPAGSYAENFMKENEVKDATINGVTKQPPEQHEVLPHTKIAETIDTDTLAGKTFVVTGDLYNYTSRDVLKGIIEAKGAKLTGRVSSKTTALVTNFPNSGTIKIKKAQELGVKIITEEEFIRLYLSE